MEYHPKFAAKLLDCVARQFDIPISIARLFDIDDTYCKSAFTEEHERLVAYIVSRGGYNVWSHADTFVRQMDEEGFRQLAMFYRDIIVGCELSTFDHMRYVITLAIFTVAALYRENNSFLWFALETIACENFYLKKKLNDSLPINKNLPTIQEELAGYSPFENILDPCTCFYT